ncbi:MAG: protein translocase subunit SecF [Spirochaetia bacterium]
MNRVIQFSKLRFFMPVLSVLLIAGLLVGTFLQGGFNLGIDFQAGLNMRVQIVPVGFEVFYEGDEDALMNVTGNSAVITIGGETGERYSFPFHAYPSLEVLSQAINRVPGVSVILEESADRTIPTERAVGFNHSVELTEVPIPVNFIVGSEEEIYASIDEVRNALSDIGNVQIQTVGDEINQEYIVRVEETGELDNFVREMTSEVEEELGVYFGADQIIVKQSDYVGPRFSQDLSGQVIYLTLLALALILAYVWFRFKLPFAVSAITALTHDVLIMIGFIGALQLEVSTATIAAVLTIIGYSLNDTIVIFDRIRENMGVMKENDYRVIVDTSINQSMSRTLITSLTTMLAVAAIYIFGSGAIKIFALNLIVGIVVGTYSSILIASPVLMGWMNRKTRRRKAKEAEKYRLKAPDMPKQAKPAAEGPQIPQAGKPEEEKKPEVPTRPQSVERKERGKKRQKKKKK